MPLSGIFFVSLHHHSNRKTMFKKTDPNPQLDIFTAPSMQLGSRASKKYSGLRHLFAQLSLNELPPRTKGDERAKLLSKEYAF